VLDRVALIVATAGGIGFAPVAPGTVASASTAVVLWLSAPSLPWLLIVCAATTAAGTWAAGRAERTLGEKDPGQIVIDEVAGMTLTVLVAGTGASALVVGFLLFRLFDVAKPFPAGASQRLRGGLGVMTDDLIAGLYGLVVLAVLRAVVGWP
jgi:phosphatidylglycerophosphatase A